MTTARIATIAAVAGLATALGAASAVAAPVSTAPPQIKGDVSFSKTIRCDPGAWSGSPASFAYQWLVGGAPRPGSAATLTIDQPFFMGGYDISCSVTATDAGGATAAATSVAVRPALGATKLTITKVTTKPGGRFVFTGKLTPAAVAKKYGGGQVVLHRPAPRFGPKAVYQLGDAANVSRRGTFTVRGTDRPGTRTITADFYPGHDGYGLWAPAAATRRVRLLAAKR